MPQPSQHNSPTNSPTSRTRNQASNTDSADRASSSQLRLRQVPRFFRSGSRSSELEEITTVTDDTVGSISFLIVSDYPRHRRANLLNWLISSMDSRETSIPITINRQGDIICSCSFSYPEKPKLTVMNPAQVAQRVILQENGTKVSEEDALSIDIEMDLRLEKLIQDRIQREYVIDHASAATKLYEYKCPLTQSIFDQPVLASDGMRYELAALREHFQANAKFDTRNDEWIVHSPMNRSKMASEVSFDKKMHDWINDTIKIENHRCQSQPDSSNSILEYGESCLFACEGSKKRARDQDNKADNKEVNSGNIKKAKI